MSHASELTLAQAAALDAGKLLLNEADPSNVLSAEGRDIKLDADRRAETLILERLIPSGIPVLTEEAGEKGDVRRDGDFWVVDPLDGTYNYHRGIRLCCVSIALCLGGKPRLGVVHHFGAGETFAGEVGAGATLNGAPMRVSSVKSPAKAILATGFPVSRDFSEASLRDFTSRVARFKKIRMFGTAALSAAYVACGRVDAYFEEDILFWDIAAGAALVEAAGGFVDVAPSARKPWATVTRLSASNSLWEE